MSGFFHLALCFQGSSMLEYVSLLHSFFFWLSNTPLYGYTTFGWKFGLFPIFGCDERCCCEHLCTHFCMNMSSVFLGMYLKMELVDRLVNSNFNLLRNYPVVFHSGCTISYSHQQRTSSSFTSSSSLAIVSLLDYRHPSEYLVVILIHISLMANAPLFFVMVVVMTMITCIY